MDAVFDSVLIRLKFNGGLAFSLNTALVFFFFFAFIYFLGEFVLHFKFL